MSGIAGILRLEGVPADRPLLRRMTASLASRGPDGQEGWCDGPVGFGHAQCRTTASPGDDRQPATLGGGVWITADARLDGRADLVREFESRGRTRLASASDAHLILHAYDAWGEDCVERLLGDFAFAIWDGRTRRLFCARDHFGVKPFYYACARGAFVFSNTLDCVRLHPAVSGELNELAIGDFLLFGFNQDPETTTFADVRRLAPAHCLVCDAAGALRVRRYWTLPADGRIRYRRAQDYVDRFGELLRTAVADRLGDGPVGVWMSGGLDSTSIAAVARQVRSGRGAPFELRAHTIVYDTLIPDQERQYSQLAADALGLEVDYFAADGYGPFEGWNRQEPVMPDPVDDPFLRVRTEQLREAGSRCRVLLCGEGADEGLWHSDVVDLWGRMPLRDLGADVARSLAIYRRRPVAGIRGGLGRWLRQAPARSAYPSWLDHAFARRADLRARWERLSGADPPGAHPLRPEAARRLTMAVWPSYLESWDPGATGVPVEGRYPFLDVRLVSYLLAIPPIPWCVGKQILRAAMRDVLPRRVRLRPKRPLNGDRLREHLRREAVRPQIGFEPAPDLARFVDWADVPPLANSSGGEDPWLTARVLCFNHWLKRIDAAAGPEKESSDADQINELAIGCDGEETLREPTVGGLWRHP